jgi:putative nucleotidyltransferase-like protein
LYRVHYSELAGETPLQSTLPLGTSGQAAEWAVLLECASPECNPQRLSDLLRRKPDWSVLIPLAEEHGVLMLLAERALGEHESSVPQEVQQKLQEKRRALLLFTLSLMAELFRALESFREAGMEALVVKGPALSARAYGDASMRRYEDVDLLVRQRDVTRFVELMTGSGYESKVPLNAIGAGKVPGEYVFRWPNTNRRIELHTEQTLRYFPHPLPVEEFFKRKIFLSFDAHTVPALCAEDELLLDCIHSAKHFWERLMWIADVAAMVSRQKDLDWDRAFLTARQVDAERMLCLGLLLAAETFPVKLPGEIERVIRSDQGAQRLAAEITGRLPSGRFARRTLLERASFRLRMRGALLPGLSYLLRLTLSPTEEDWAGNDEKERIGLFTALRRPLRLARKYRRESSD